MTDDWLLMADTMLETIRIEPMRQEDIRQVMEIDGASFPVNWSWGTYAMELRNAACHLFVARAAGAEANPGIGGGELPTETKCSPVIGYAGTWLGGEELHITTLAVDPKWRRRRISLRLLLHALEDGRRRGARRVTLEVRASNTAARRLYDSLGFVVSGIRKGYYQETGEDAVLMWLRDLWAPETIMRLRRGRQRVDGADGRWLNG